MVNLVVYRILNLRTKKIYIGSTGDFEIRKMYHLSQLRQAKHCNRFLQREFNEYKESAFVFEVVADGFKSREQMLFKEYELILKTKAYNYNIETNCPILDTRKTNKRKPKWNPGSGMIHGKKNKRQPKKKRYKVNIKTQYPEIEKILERKNIRISKSTISKWTTFNS